MLCTPIIVAAKDNPDAEGIMVSMDIVSTPVKNPETNEVVIEHRTLCGVCWNDARSPAISMHDSEQLEWLEIPGVTDVEEDEGDELPDEPEEE